MVSPLLPNLGYSNKMSKRHVIEIKKNRHGKISHWLAELTYKTDIDSFKIFYWFFCKPLHKYATDKITSFIYPQNPFINSLTECEFTVFLYSLEIAAFQTSSFH